MAKLLVSSDCTSLKADGRDLAFITVTVADKDGQMVPRSNNPVQFEVTGPAQLVATDNDEKPVARSYRALDYD